GTLIEDAPNDAPFARHQLIRSVNVGIAIDHAVRMGFQDGIFGAFYEPRKALLLLALHQGRILGYRDLEAGREVHRRIEVAAIARHAADGDKAGRLAGERFGDEADATVGRDDHVEGAIAERRLDGFAEMRVAVDMLDFGADFRNFVGAAMENRNLKASLNQSTRQEGTGRSGPA